MDSKKQLPLRVHHLPVLQWKLPRLWFQYTQNGVAMIAEEKSSDVPTYNRETFTPIISVGVLPRSGKTF
jgi:hypothetical protein